MLSVLPPLDAYRDDLARAGAPRFGPADARWLQLATVLARTAQLPPAERPAALARAAAVVRAWPTEEDDAGGDGSTFDPEPLAASLAAAAGALDGRTDGDDGAADTVSALSALTAAVQVAVEELERAGAFRLAFATLAALRAALPALAPSLAGRILAQQGRIARQVGALDDAHELYASAERQGRAAGDVDLRVRALLGRGVLAHRRGNYPQTRTLSRRALRLASAAGLDAHVAAAHHALLIAALGVRDVESALLHGWAAFHGTGAHGDGRAEVLGMLAETALTAGQPEAALRACLSALEQTRLARLRLPILGAAAKAAARLGRQALLRELAHTALRELGPSQHAAENAQLLLDLAEAHAEARDEARARELASRAVDLARQGRFFEVLHRAQAVLATLDARDLTATELVPPMGARETLSPASRRVVRALEALRPSTTAAGAPG